MDRDLALLAVKALAGGGLVVLFSLVSAAVRPRIFSGVFSAAPSVALAGLLVIALQKKPPAAVAGARGMALGSFAMLAYCLVAYVLARRLGARLGSVAAWSVWLLVGLGLYFLVPP